MSPSQVPQHSQVAPSQVSRVSQPSPAAASGSQPSPAADPMIVDLDGAEDPNCNIAHQAACLPYDFGGVS